MRCKGGSIVGRSRKFTGIRAQLFRGYMFPMTAILMLFAIVLAVISTNKLSDEMHTYYKTTSTQFNLVLDEYIKRMDDGILQLYESSEVSQYLTNAIWDCAANDSAMRQSVYQRLKEFLDFDSGIFSVSVATLDGQRLTYSRNGYERVSRSFTQEDYYQSLKQSNGDTQLFVRQKTDYSFTAAQDVFVICKKFLDDGEGGDPEAVAYTGFVIIECRMDTLREFFDASDLDWAGSSVLLDKHGRLIYSNLDADPTEAEIASMLSQQRSVLVGGRRMYAVLSTSKLSGATVVGLIPVGEISENTSQVIFLFAVMCAVCVLLILVLSERFSNIYTKPIRALCSAMDRFRKGDFDTSIEVAHQNEFGELEQNFNKLTRDVKTLTTTVVDAEKKLHEIGIKSLYGQIEPHFLYNTLDAIRSLAILNDDKQTGDAIVKLANLFRYNSSMKGDFVPVRAELNNIRDYLDLQKLCYSRKFDYSIHVPAELEELPVMRFCLQPVVENAIVHGFRNVRSGGALEISIQRQEAVLHIVIRDNGCGIAPDELEALRSALSAGTQDGHIGLRNISDRLRLYFGTAHTLHIESDGHSGTTVWFDLPCGDEHALRLPDGMGYYER